MSASNNPTVGAGQSGGTEVGGSAVGWTRFSFGRFSCTVVSDGPLILGPARESFPDVAADDVDRAQARLGLPADRVVLDQNLLLVDTGAELVLVDTGVGAMPDLGRRIYGPQSGQAMINLASAGIDPADIDVIALTHAHPDHAWGLLDADGQPAFPRARILIGEADFAHFTDAAQAEAISDSRVRNQYTGARTCLLPYGDRITPISDGQQVGDGITAIHTPGHSPGHLVYEIANSDMSLIVWGDLCHHPLLLERPDWNFRFDQDKELARQQRERIFRRIVEADHLVLSYHFPFPGLGRLRHDGEKYSWDAVEPERGLVAGETVLR